jgi:putative tributyrin esterase
MLFRACRTLALLLVVCSWTACGAQPPGRRGTVRTDAIWSQALGVTKKVVVYLPPSYADTAPARRYPVAVYLHGGFGNETDWTEQGHLSQVMDSLVATGMQEMIVLMPDGDDGWWTTWHGLNDLAACRRASRSETADTYCVPWPKYDDYVTYDVLAYADSAFRTIPRRESRGIAGMSMGGYGAITIAARSPGHFAVAASHGGFLRPALLVDSSTVQTTGRVTIRDARTLEELRAVSGARWARIAPAFGTDSVSWMSRDPARLIERMLARGDVVPSLFVDVGTEDYLLPMNRSFRDRMAELRVPVLYAERSGQHDWDYWRTHLPESLRFIADRMVP